MNKNTIEGYATFNHLKDDDDELRIKNTAQVMANIIEDNTSSSGQITGKGASIIYQYFENVLEEDKEAVYLLLKEKLYERGYQ